MDLIKACISEDIEKALSCMDIGMNLDIFDADGRTALLGACKKSLKEVALELIKTGQVDKYDIMDIICAYQNKMKEMTLELIKTVHAKLDQISEDGNTVLIWACQNRMIEVALELIKMGY